MANAIYTPAKTAFLTGLIDLEGDTIVCALIDTDDYTFSAAHEFWDDVAAGAVIDEANLSNASVTNGVFDADDVEFTGVSGDQFEAIILYQDTGNAATSRLIAYIDTGTGFPLTPNGGDITVQWDNGANKIFSL